MICKLSHLRDVNDVRDIYRLIRQLSPNLRERDLIIKVVVRFKEMTANEHTLILVKRDIFTNRIVGMASLICVQKLTGFTGQIEDVVVDKRYRKQGIAKQLTLQLIEQAKEWHVKHVDLTSNPARVEANALYLKLGFVLRGTNAYRLSLTP